MIDGVIPEKVNYEDLLPSALEGEEIERRAGEAAAFAFHPGDTLKDGRYRPFRKIGEGQYSTVWLARDEEENRYVAIKIGLTWEADEESNEISSLKLLRENPIPDHPALHHVVELLDDFVHAGPNGSHTCLVIQPLGRDVETALSYDCESNTPAPYPFTRRISIQTLQALDYLHQHSIMHGDLHPANIALALTHDINKDSEDEIQAKNERGIELNYRDDVHWLDDGIVVPKSDPEDANAVLIDLGASTHPADERSLDYAYPTPYRAPEVVMETGNVTCKADIWALGCVIFRIVTHYPLFAPEYWGSYDEMNIEHIHMIVERLGAVPASLRSAWEDADKYLTPDGQMKEPYPEDQRERPLVEQIVHNKPSGMGEEELKAFVEFMSSMIRFEPSERSSTHDLLQHRWVTAL
ncbi:hypothetical protein PENSTE_c021G01368 [Penicillium steckii]|uniref:non-specific serine/threonine protein kinase n=1 Tax=Penicillium steckii TaxID=303698 RepID=A0A1V6ST89_9EURO|nr:hypothetical protein PENSTE_c021G01368 [Penicillium steckii]